MAQKVWDTGDFAPNAAPVLMSGPWQSLANDLFVPLVNLGQDDAWAPSTSRGIWGKVAHNLIWLIKTIGWVMTAMVAGAVAGVIRND